MTHEQFPILMQQDFFHSKPPISGFRFGREIFAILVGVASLVFMASCGYRFVGSDGPPHGVDKLYIENIVNKTTEPEIDVLITDALKNEFLQKYRGTLTSRQRAQAVLSGTLVGIRTETVARRGSLTSLERRVLMTIDLTLKSMQSERLWYAKGITSSDTYSVISGDKEASEQNKREALRNLVDILAENSFNRLANDF